MAKTDGNGSTTLDGERSLGDTSMAPLDGAPALVASALGPPGYGGPTHLPIGYLRNPRADPATSFYPTGVDAVSTAAVSPDGRYLAVGPDDSGTDPQQIEVLLLETRQILDTVTYAGAKPKIVAWSPDSRAFTFFTDQRSYLHRVGAKTVSSGSTAGFAGRNRTVLDGASFSSDENETRLVIGCANTDSLDFAYAVTTADPAGVAMQVSDGCSSRDTIFDGGTATQTVLALKGVLYRYTARGELLPVATPALDKRVGVQGCERLVWVSLPGDVDYVVAPSEGRVTPVRAASGCPIQSPDGSSFAIRTGKDAAVVVGNLTKGTTVVVAPAGVPVAFSDDGSTLLVETAAGMVLARSDGSGAKPASVDFARLDRPNANAAPGYCRGHLTGDVLIKAAQGVVLYDIGADNAKPMPVDQIGRSCHVSIDNKWLVSGNLLVRLDTRMAEKLQAVDKPTGKRGEPSPRSMDAFSFAGPQRTVSSTDGRGALRP